MCLQCESNLENCWHLFITCEDSVACWKEANLWDRIEPLLVRVDSFTELFFTVNADLCSSMRNLFAMVLWSIWKRRNDRLWEERIVSNSQVISRAKEVLTDWITAKERFQPNLIAHHSRIEDKWSKPPLGYLKCNLDAAFVQGRIGIGMCLKIMQADLLRLDQHGYSLC